MPIGGMIKKVFGTSHEREIKRLRPRVERINGMEEAWKKLSDAELRGKTAEFRQKLDNGAKLDDFLATRDAEWMGRIYKFLGLTVGTIVHGQSDREKQLAYRSDITYGTNNEFGFDYLRDNMKDSIERYVQRELHYAIVDEVDSILIDEARTPLIISGPAEESTELYYRVNQMIPS